MTLAPYILVSDFDGTITRNDFYSLVVERLLTPGDLVHWQDYRAGKISHFTALQRIFGSIRAPEEKLLAIVRGMEPDPYLAASLAALRAARWDVVVASAGCDWYIRRILADLHVSLEVHANPGAFAPEPGSRLGSLRMEAPADSPFYSPATGVDKAAIVRFHQERGAVTAYAGDGFTDAPAALLVAPERRFARADLADVLRERGEPFRPFSAWSDVARALLAGEETP